MLFKAQAGRRRPTALDLLFALAQHIDAQELRKRLQGEFEQHGKRTLRRTLGEFLPAKMVEPYIALSGIPGDRLGHQTTGEERTMSYVAYFHITLPSSAPSA